MTKNKLTTRNLVELFGVTAMTIHTWKKGTPTKTAMPASLTPKAVAAWAKKNGVTMLVKDPQSLVGTGYMKPGPKPRIHRVPYAPAMKAARG